jgi:hypothetical protein
MSWRAAALSESTADQLQPVIECEVLPRVSKGRREGETYPVLCCVPEKHAGGKLNRKRAAGPAVAEAGLRSGNSAALSHFPDAIRNMLAATTQLNLHRAFAQSLTAIRRIVLMKSLRTTILVLFAASAGSLTLLAQTNTVEGAGALNSNTSGAYNSAFGRVAMYSNTTGSFNSAFGMGALSSNVTNSYGAAFGYGALGASTGPFNSAFGSNSLNANTTGFENGAFGYRSLYSNTTGNQNQAFGYQALYSNTTGSQNTAVGLWPLYYNTTGQNNVAVGSWAAGNNIDGNENIAVGDASLYNNLNGSNNVAIGQWALGNNQIGSNNIAIGNSAGYNNFAGYSNNVDIANEGSSEDNGVVRIGTAGQQQFIYLSGVYGVATGLGNGVDVMVDSNGQLGVKNSSIRFKEDVRDMADASSGILLLRPVTYRYKQAYADGSKPIDYGLIAEEVAEVYPDLVARSANGQIVTVQYQKLTPMLLNELQKQHRQLEQQQQTIDQLKAQQAITMHRLEERLSALEAAQPRTAEREVSLATK